MLVLDGPAADAQFQPATRDLVQRGRHLGQHRGMPKLVAQHQVSDPQPFGPAQQGGGQRPALQGVDVRNPGPVHVVVEPQRADAELLTAPGPVQNLGEGEAHLGTYTPMSRPVTA